LYEVGKKGIQGQFKQLLLDIATNNETSFFRDPKMFKSFEQLLKNHGTELAYRNLRIWSAASSTGQEALSLAMLIQEYNLKNSSKIQFSIVGTDISERVLTKAKAGTYSQLEVQRGLPSPYLIKYFKKDDSDFWIANRELTRDIEFKKQNLKEPFIQLGDFDFIFCRNVLIYQNVEGKKEILSRMTSMLRPGGHLILGSGESLLGLSTDYEQENIDGAIFYRKKLETSQAA
jgi:chemotaxis protein methyltransferase CheR